VLATYAKLINTRIRPTKTIGREDKSAKNAKNAKNAKALKPFASFASFAFFADKTF